MYDDARFFTVTGDHVDVTPSTVEQRADALRAIHADYVAHDDGAGDPDPDAGDVDVNLDDDALVSKAKDAENGDKFRRLWNGDTVGYQSQSEADMALCSMLAFWTGGDRARIDRLFRRSGLYRDKWDEDRGEQTYGEQTIAKVLKGVSDVYDPDRDNTGDVSTALPDAPTPPDDIASADADGRDGSNPDADVNHGDDVDGDSLDVTLCPAEVMAWAGLREDDDLSDLNDRQKAASVWELLKHSDRYHVRVRRDTESLWAYDDGVWTATGERALRHTAREALGSMNYGANVLAELKAQARADPSVEVDADDMGLDPGYLAVGNGLVDLDAAADGAGDDALRDLHPEDYALTRLPVEYDPDTDFERWAKYVEEWAEDGRADALQEYVGYCLHVGGMPIHRALLLVGSGANGKGTFLSVVRALLGRENTTSIELQTLANDENYRDRFYGAIANIDDDLSARKIGQGLGMFKKLTAGDPITAAQKYHDPYKFDATPKHLYAANEVPQVDVADDDEAFWRRWLLVEFPNHYPPSQRDPDLRDELSTDDALSGVLNWGIEGRKRLLDQGKFTGEDEFAQAKRERWQAWGESVDKFTAECVERDPDADRITNQDAHRRYAAWCRENGLDPVGQRKFTNTVKNEDIEYGKHRIDGKVQRGYKALGLSDDVPALDDTPERASPDDAHQDSLF
jgi:putative DNA primase/helicase